MSAQTNTRDPVNGGELVAKDVAERIASRVAAALTATAPSEECWRDKRELAEHYSCSVRSIETALAEGMPHAVIFGRVKCQVSQIDPWLRERGHLRESDAAPTLLP